MDYVVIECEGLQGPINSLWKDFDETTGNTTVTIKDALGKLFTVVIPNEAYEVVNIPADCSILG